MTPTVHSLRLATFQNPPYPLRTHPVDIASEPDSFGDFGSRDQNEIEPAARDVDKNSLTARHAHQSTPSPVSPAHLERCVKAGDSACACDRARAARSPVERCPPPSASHAAPVCCASPCPRVYHPRRCWFPTLPGRPRNARFEGRGLITDVMSTFLKGFQQRSN